jgi:Phosphoenolpyruvate carboxylase
VLHHCLVHPHVNVKEYLENDPEAYTSKEEFLKPLTLIYHSLIDSGDTYIAHGRILDVIRQVGSRICLESGMQWGVCVNHAPASIAARLMPSLLHNPARRCR